MVRDDRKFVNVGLTSEYANMLRSLRKWFDVGQAEAIRKCIGLGYKTFIEGKTPKTTGEDIEAIKAELLEVRQALLRKT